MLKLNFDLQFRPVQFGADFNKGFQEPVPIFIYFFEKAVSQGFHIHTTNNRNSKHAPNMTQDE